MAATHEHRLVPLFIQLKTRKSPAWECFVTLTPQYSWGCLDCDHVVALTHAAAVERGLALCHQL